MLQSLILVCVLASLVSAQSVSFFFPGGKCYDGVDPVVSVKSANASTTEFRVACPSGTNATNCGWGPGVDYTVVSKTSYKASVSYDSSTMNLGCLYNSQSTQMSCVASFKGASITNSLMSTILSGSDASFITASVVSGASLISSTPTASMSMTTAAASGSRITSGATATGPKSAAKTGAASRFRIEMPAIFALGAVTVFNFL